MVPQQKKIFEEKLKNPQTEICHAPSLFDIWAKFTNNDVFDIENMSVEFACDEPNEENDFLEFFRLGNVIKQNTTNLSMFLF